MSDLDHWNVQPLCILNCFWLMFSSLKYTMRLNTIYPCLSRLSQLKLNLKLPTGTDIEVLEHYIFTTIFTCFPPWSSAVTVSWTTIVWRFAHVYMQSGGPNWEICWCNNAPNCISKWPQFSYLQLVPTSKLAPISIRLVYFHMVTCWFSKKSLFLCIAPSFGHKKY